MFDESASRYLPPTLDLSFNLSSKDEVSEAEMPPDERETETLEESPVSFRLSVPNERMSRFHKSDEESASSGDSECIPHPESRGHGLRVKKRERRRCWSTTWIGTSQTDTNPSPRRVMTGPRKRSLRRPQKPQYWLMSNYADLPARRTLLCVLDTTSTWVIIMHT